MCCKDVRLPSNEIKITFEFQGMTMQYEGVLGENNHLEEFEGILKQMINGIGYSFVQECWLMKKEDLEELRK